MLYAVRSVLADKPTTAQVAGPVNNRFDHLDIQISVSAAVMGSSRRVGPDRDHSVIVPLRRQRGSRLPANTVVEGGHRGFASMAAGRYELASQSDGLGFRGVLGRENASLTEELTAELAGILSWVVGRVGPADPSGEVH